MKFKTLLFLHFLVFQLAYGNRPTVHASNFKISDTSCNAATLRWTSGNGNARLIVGREGTSSSFIPIDGDMYGANSSFGSNSKLDSNNNYAVYNANGTTYVMLTNLKEGTTYTFYIFEHDNDLTNPQYLTTNAPSITFTTYRTTLDFNILPIDSCQRTNLFRLTNTSISTIPGQTFYFQDGLKNYDASKPTEIHFNGAGYLSIKLIANIYKGCKTNVTKDVKIFPRKVGGFSNLNSTDTIKDFPNNVFNLSCQGYLMPFPIGITYHWNFGDGNESYFAKPKKSYQRPGVYKVSLELGSTTYSKATACKDTIYTHLIVKPYPYLDLKWDRDTIYANIDNYIASVNSDSAVKLTWYFGDADSSTNDTTSHIYSTAGKYSIRLHIKTNYGYEGDTSREVVVIDKKVNINQSIFNEIKIGPNPSNNQIIITNPNDLKLNIAIYNSNGQLMYKNNINELTHNIDVSEFESGVYALIILENGTVLGSQNISILK